LKRRMSGCRSEVEEQLPSSFQLRFISVPFGSRFNAGVFAREPLSVSALVEEWRVNEINRQPNDPGLPGTAR
jgi:hypothetical protein